MDPYAQAILLDSPVGYYRHADANDSSGNGNHGTNSGVTFTRAGAIAGTNNPAGTYSGALMSVGDLIDTSADFTLETWAIINGQSDQNVLFASGTGTSNFWFVDARPDVGLCFQTYAGGFEPIAANGYVLTPGEWTHIAVRRVGNLYTIFANGVADSSGTSSTTYARATISLGGISVPGLTINFSGFLDESALYGSGLSDARILAHYNAGRLQATQFRRQRARFAV
jgi:hypothetical protein